MRRRIQRIIGGCCGLMLALAAQAGAQTKCNSSQDAAVQCFVTNATNTGLATLPPGQTLTQFKAYGVAVSNIIQTPKTVVFVLGIAGAAVDALPPRNADGTPNQAAQDGAVNAIVDAALTDGLVSLPASTTSDQLKQFAREITVAMDQNAGPTLAVGSVLRLVDSIINSATSGGTVDWAQVSANLSTLINGFVAAGLLKIPATASLASINQFSNSAAQAIYNYKIATGKATL